LLRKTGKRSTWSGGGVLAERRGRRDSDVPWEREVQRKKINWGTHQELRARDTKRMSCRSEEKKEGGKGGIENHRRRKQKKREPGGEGGGRGLYRQAKGTINQYLRTVWRGKGTNKSSKG